MSEKDPASVTDKFTFNWTFTIAGALGIEVNVTGNRDLADIVLGHVHDMVEECKRYEARAHQEKASEAAQLKTDEATIEAPDREPEPDSEGGGS